jgi:radical SAM superfamily enzyme YgiQ (UPF0313 family)
MRILLVANVSTTHAGSGLPPRPNMVAGSGGLRLVIEEAPLGLLAIASPVERAGHQVRVLNFAEEVRAGRLPLREQSFVADAAAYLAQLDFDLVGFTSRSDTYPTHVLIAQALAVLRPECVIVFGGPQATAVHEQTLSRLSVPDVVVRNEGEQAFAELVDALSMQRPLDDIAGISWRTASGEVKINAARPLVANLDDLPLPAFDLYPYPNAHSHVEVGRGCPFTCTFCATNTFFARRYRLKSPKRVIQEIRLIMDLYGTRDFTFTHDMLTIDKRRVAALARELIEADLKIQWRCSARIDCVDDELLELMAAAGCTSMFFGIEHGSARMQAIIDKRLDVDQVVPTALTCLRLGIAPTCSFIYGFPEETPADLSGTLRLVTQLKDAGVSHVQLHRLSLLVDTPLSRTYRDQIQLIFNTGDATAGHVHASAAEQLILEHPDMFSSQLTGPLFHLQEEALHNVDTLVYALESVAWSVRIALRAGLFADLWELHRTHQEAVWSAQPTRRGHVLENAAYVRSLFSFLQRMSSRAELPPWYADVVEYERQVFEALLAARSHPSNAVAAPGRPNLVPTSIAESYPLLPPTTCLASYHYPVHELMSMLPTASDVLTVACAPAACILVMRYDTTGLVTAQVSPLLAALLGLCDGQRSAREITDAVWRARGMVGSAADLSDTWYAALRDLLLTGLLQISALG